MTGDRPAIQIEEVVVRECADGRHDLGKRIVEGHDVDGLEMHGWGFTHAEAFDRIRDVSDPRDYDPGTHLATVRFDVVEKTYSIDWKVYLGPLQRIQDYRWSQEGLSP